MTIILVIIILLILLKFAQWISKKPENSLHNKDDNNEYTVYLCEDDNNDCNEYDSDDDDEDYEYLQNLESNSWWLLGALIDINNKHNDSKKNKKQ